MELPEVGATLRSYVAGSGALQAIAVVPGGIVACDAGGLVSWQAAEDDDAVALEVGDAPAATLDPPPKRLPPFAVDSGLGEVSGPLGGLEHVAEVLLGLTVVLGSPSVAIVLLETTDDTALALSAREGEGVVVVIGDEQFQMEEGWPPRRPAP